MQFKDFVSNDNVIADISEAAEKGTLPHAILIDGAKGTGKRTLAEILSRYAVCTAEHDRPCGVCPGCRKALHGNHTDIYIANGENSGELSVDAIRRIRADAFVKPNEAPMKAFLLLNCDKMLAPAQNAFLKVLEEPPRNVMFIMTVTSANMLLQTVRSRVRLYSLFPAEAEDAIRFLTEKYPQSDNDSIVSAVRITSGNIGQASEIIEAGGEEAQLLAQQIIKEAAFGTEYDLLVLTNKLAKDRSFAVRTLDYLVELSACCIKASVGAETNNKTAVDVASRISKKRLMNMNDNIARARKVLKTNINMNFFGTWFSSVLKA